MTICLARRTNIDLRDRRFSPYVYDSIQCTNDAIVAGNGLCSTCVRHRDLFLAGRDAAVTWHGRVDEPMIEGNMHPQSQIRYGVWYQKRLVAGTLRFSEVPRIQTARQEGKLKIRPAVPSAQLARYARGECFLDIPTLCARNQISSSELRDAIALVSSERGCVLDKNRLPTDRSALATMISRLSDNVVEPVQKNKVIWIPDWTLAPAGVQIRWFHSTGSYYGTHLGNGVCADLNGNEFSTLSGFAVAEFKKLQANGVISKTLKHSVNGWMTVQFQTIGVWQPFHTIRSRA